MDIEKYSVPLWNNSSEEDIRFMLRRHGLSNTSIDLVCDYVLKHLSFQQIAKKYGYINKESAAYYYNKAIKRLRSRGFKFE